MDNVVIIELVFVGFRIDFALQKMDNVDNG
jgi:hypothetical protein